MSNSAFTPTFNASTGSITSAQLSPGTWSYGKNAIINGAFDIWQRGTSFTGLTGAVNTYGADRWELSTNNDGVVTMQRSSDVPTLAQAGILTNYSVHIDCTTADASIAAGQYSILWQKVEGYNWRQFAQRDLTLSFWVKATKTGTYCTFLLNSGADRAYVSEYTVDATDTWEKKTINIPASPSAGTWDYTTGIGTYVGFCIADGSTFQTTADAWQTGNYHSTSNQVNGLDSASNDFRLALVQLEVGDAATDFEVVDFATELLRCKRYFQKTFPYATTPTQNHASTANGWYVNQSGGASTAQLQGTTLEMEMRAAPTVTLYTYSAGNYGWNSAVGAFAGGAPPTTGVIGGRGWYMSYTSAAGSAAGTCNIFFATFSAEL